MKKNILNIVLAGCALVVTTSCSDYLETSSPSTITENSATTSVAGCRSVIDGTYTNFHDVLVSHLFGNGMFYAGDMAGSDIERHGGERAANRIPYETFYFGGDADTRANYNSATEFKPHLSAAILIICPQVLESSRASCARSRSPRVLKTNGREE